MSRILRRICVNILIVPGAIPSRFLGSEKPVATQPRNVVAYAKLLVNIYELYNVFVYLISELIVVYTVIYTEKKFS